eukprot:g43721.t1
MVSRFADDTKIGGIVDRGEGYVRLKWAEKSQMEFNLDKCEVLHFGHPVFKKDIIKLESVQKRFTKMLPGMESLSYKSTLERLGLSSLERRRMRGDLIEVYKIMRVTDKVNDKALFPRVGDFKGREHIFK